MPPVQLGSLSNLLSSEEAGVTPKLGVEAAPAPPMEEAQRLALDSSLAMQSLNWAPRHDAASAIAATARWYEAWRSGADGRALALAEIEEALAP